MEFVEKMTLDSNGNETVEVSGGKLLQLAEGFYWLLVNQGGSRYMRLGENHVVFEIDGRFDYLPGANSLAYEYFVDTYGGQCFLRTFGDLDYRSTADGQCFLEWRNPSHNEKVVSIPSNGNRQIIVEAEDLSAMFEGFKGVKIYATEFRGALVGGRMNHLLNHCLFNGVGFERVDLTDLSLRNTRFKGCLFRDCDLDARDFEGVVFEGCEIEGGTLNGFIFSSSSRDCVFSDLDLRKFGENNLDCLCASALALIDCRFKDRAVIRPIDYLWMNGRGLSEEEGERYKLSRFYMMHSRVVEGELQRRPYEYVALRNYKFEDGSANDTEWSTCEVEDVEFLQYGFKRVKMRGVFRRVSFNDCSFRYADLRGIVFEDCAFVKCDFEGVNLGGAVFQGRCLVEGSSFKKAKLVGTDMRGIVNLMQADSFDGASFRGLLRAAKLPEGVHRRNLALLHEKGGGLALSLEGSLSDE